MADVTHTSAGVWVAGKSAGETVIGICTWGVLHVALMIGAYQLITYARRHSEIDKALNAVHLTPNWNWLAASLAASLVDIPLQQYIVRRHADEVKVNVEGQYDKSEEVAKNRFNKVVKIKTVLKRNTKLSNENAALRGQLQGQRAGIDLSASFLSTGKSPITPNTQNWQVDVVSGESEDESDSDTDRLSSTSRKGGTTGKL